MKRSILILAMLASLAFGQTYLGGDGGTYTGGGGGGGGGVRLAASISENGGDLRIVAKVDMGVPINVAVSAYLDNKFTWHGNGQDWAVVDEDTTSAVADGRHTFSLVPSGWTGWEGDTVIVQARIYTSEGLAHVEQDTFVLDAPGVLHTELWLSDTSPYVPEFVSEGILPADTDTAAVFDRTRVDEMAYAYLHVSFPDSLYRPSFVATSAYRSVYGGGASASQKLVNVWYDMSDIPTSATVVWSRIYAIDHGDGFNVADGDYLHARLDTMSADLAWLDADRNAADDLLAKATWNYIDRSVVADTASNKWTPNHYQRTNLSQYGVAGGYYDPPGTSVAGDAPWYVDVTDADQVYLDMGASRVNAGYWFFKTTFTDDLQSSAGPDMEIGTAASCDADPVKIMQYVTPPQVAQVDGGDTTPPLIGSANATVAYTENGGSATVSISAASDEAVTWTAVADYRSSYPLYDDAESASYTWKTRAVGEHSDSTGPSLEIVGFELSLDTGVYHSDSLTVSIYATDANGNDSDPVEVLDVVVAMPLGAPPSLDGTTWGALAYQSGGDTPYSGTIAEWANTTAAMVSTDHILGTEYMANNGYGPGWVQDVRDYAGSANGIIVAHGGEHCQSGSTSPYAQRKNAWALALYDSLSAAGSADTLAFVHGTDGRLLDIWPYGYDSPTVNFVNQLGRERFAQFIAAEIDHADNRVPYMGLVFDRWEPYDSYTAWNATHTAQAPAATNYDCDRDGTALGADLDEQVARLAGQTQFFYDIRNALRMTNADSVATNYFLLGCNSAYAFGDTARLAATDVIYHEDFGCPQRYTYAWGQYPYHNVFDAEWEDLNHGSTHLLQINGYWPNTGSYMAHPDELASFARTRSGGPWFVPERRGEDDITLVEPEPSEVFGLLMDNVLPIYTNPAEGNGRRCNSPIEEGLYDLRNLGSATAAAVVDTTSYPGYWRITRDYDNGSVEVQMVDRASWDCETSELSYLVTVDGYGVARQSAVWPLIPATATAPVLDYFGVSDPDSTEADGNWTVWMDFEANEGVTAVVKYATTAEGLAAADTVVLGSGLLYYGGQRSTGIALDDLNSGYIYSSITLTDLSDSTTSSSSSVAVQRADSGVPTITPTDSTYTEASELAAVSVTTDELVTFTYRTRVNAGAWSSAIEADTTATAATFLYDTTALSDDDVVLFEVAAVDGSANEADLVYIGVTVSRAGGGGGGDTLTLYFSYGCTAVPTIENEPASIAVAADGDTLHFNNNMWAWFMQPQGADSTTAYSAGSAGLYIYGNDSPGGAFGTAPTSREIALIVDFGFTDIIPAGSTINEAVLSFWNDDAEAGADSIMVASISGIGFDDWATGSPGWDDACYAYYDASATAPWSIHWSTIQPMAGDLGDVIMMASVAGNDTRYETDVTSITNLADAERGYIIWITDSGRQWDIGSPIDVVTDNRYYLKLEVTLP